MKGDYKYYNPNPDAKPGKKWHRDDCVIRAFTCALNKSWTNTYKDLCEVGLRYFDIPLSHRVIEAYAKMNGMTKVSLPNYLTLKEFARTHDGTFICNIHSHLVCVKENMIWDAWDCGNYKVKTYYVKNK